jgi:hypothetical protein
MVDAQSHKLRFQEACVICPVPACSSPLNLTDIGRCLSKEKQNRLNSAISDANNQQHSLMQKTDTFCAKDKAVEIAQLVRNDILNLMCPHCHTVYAEFDGCMAVNCAHCNKWFCGHCHAGFSNSDTSHSHVLTCSMNTNRSYFSDPTEKRQVQTKYRTQKVKNLLSNHPKEIQDAALLELQKDLADLGINHDTIMH